MDISAGKFKIFSDQFNSENYKKTLKTLQNSSKDVVQNTKLTKDEIRLKEACQNFEAMFMDQIFKTMRKSGFKSELIDKSFGEEVFTEMLDSKMSEIASQNSTGGLADMMYDQMKIFLDMKTGNNGNKFPSENAADGKNNSYKGLNADKQLPKNGGINIAS